VETWEFFGTVSLSCAAAVAPVFFGMGSAEFHSLPSGIRTSAVSADFRSEN
jgi:hypothetical protein